MPIGVRLLELLQARPIDLPQLAPLRLRLRLHLLHEERQGLPQELLHSAALHAWEALRVCAARAWRDRGEVVCACATW